MNGPKQYRKKPVVIEAIQYFSFDRFVRETGGEWEDIILTPRISRTEVWNVEENDWLIVPEGHWLIRGVKGEYYPCSPEVFEMTYEAVE